jgi:prophage regulatory protein
MNEQPLAVGANRLGEMLGVAERTIRRWNAAGKLPRPVKIGGAIRWRLDEIEAWLAAGCPDREHWEAIQQTTAKAG